MQIHFRRFVPLVALGCASFASIGAQAYQGEQNPLPPQPFQPSLSRAAVQQEAMRPLRISNGGTGMAQPARLADRATVRSEARAISAKGAATYGETQR
ncbi:hypothetical protein GCM10023165_23280 [Variovorax defluvii]|uniref:DUF4148 domain-containing protein n=1 Tax=Variovorax defluvii TaxID=913761 RepID=A0ABP8HNU2_9BURK